MTRYEFMNKFPTPYFWLLINDRALLNKYFPLKNKQFNKMSDSEIFDLVKKYKSRTQIAQDNASLYTHLRKYRKHILKKVKLSRRVLDKKTVKASAKKFKTRNSWKKGDPDSYRKASENGWLNFCCLHMKKSSTASKTVKCLETGVIYNSVTLAGKKSGINCECIRRVANGKSKTAGGYRWAYCDEDGNILNNKGRKK